MDKYNVEHHKRYEYCRTRLKYRQGRKLKAVKVYTIGNESQHLLIFGVPKINLLEELKHRLQTFGKIEHVRNITDDWIKRGEELERFTDIFWVKFSKVEKARKCKYYLDAKEFYGGILHISYAPEYETHLELKNKLDKRRLEINYCLSKNKTINLQMES